MIKLESSLEPDCAAIHGAASRIRTTMPSKWAIDTTNRFCGYLNVTSASFAQFLETRSLATPEDRQATAEWLVSKDGKIHNKCHKLWEAMPRMSTARSVALNQGWDDVVSLAESSETAVSFAKDVVDRISTQAALALKAIPTDEGYVRSDERDRRSVLQGLSNTDGMLCGTMQQLFTQYHSAILDPSILKLRPLLKQFETLHNDLTYAREYLPAGTLDPNEGPDLLDVYLTSVQKSVRDYGRPEYVTDASRRILGLNLRDPSEREALLSVLSMSTPPKDAHGYGEWFDTVQTRYARRMESVGSSQEGAKGGSIGSSQALTRMPSSSGSAIIEACDMVGRKKPRKIQFRARRDPGVASDSSCSTGKSV
jgi:hypothetical protein